MTKHLPTRLLALLTALSLSLLFTACGASSKGQSSETAMDAEAEEVIYENTAAEAPADKANSMLSDPLSQASGWIEPQAHLARKSFDGNAGV